MYSLLKLHKHLVHIWRKQDGLDSCIFLVQLQPSIFYSDLVVYWLCDMIVTIFVTQVTNFVPCV